MADTISFLGAAEPGAKRVTRTGIALVHENEIIYPAAGSTAEAIQALEDARSRIEVYFPVQVEIREAGADRPAASTRTVDPLARLAALLGE
ncbi:hypothetical protein EJC47_19710 [Sphingomonas sp. TF3]|uniref:hypothetical protein n=1 Tax=Sphingomonas sp. TF3 TaxID=2495580 RepID=UPI000F89D3F7|nr:hypothetical protein [Sphingomonas sp. TF3]RUN74784.1 hypothetical protein EJC47_19710 [Sphingomonas sp. TF3]